MFAITKRPMQAMANPDVCKIPAPPMPPIPTPFPNIGMAPTANPVTTKIRIENQPALTKKSKIKPSNGDQGGSVGGVVSGKIMGDVEIIAGSSKVIFEGNPAATMAKPNTKQNKGNAMGNFIPSPSKVTIAG